MVIKLGSTKELSNFVFFRLYEKGFSPQLHNIYPTVEFPVSRGTPMISPKIIWKHHKDWWVTLYKCDDQLDLEEASVKVMLNDPGYSFLSGHVIDGNNQNVFVTFLV